MTDEEYARCGFDLDDFDDGRENCPNCGKPMTADEDGDGVMTMPVYFCEHCGDDEPPQPTEGIP